MPQTYETVASLKQQPGILQIMDEFQIVVGYEHTEYKYWLDTKQQIQPSIENVKSCCKTSMVTEIESQTIAWYDTGTESQMVATHNHTKTVSQTGMTIPNENQTAARYRQTNCRDQVFSICTRYLRPSDHKPRQTWRAH